DVHDSAVADTPAPPALALLGYNPVNARTLARLAPDHVRVRMVSAEGWLVAAGGSLDLDIPASEEQGWLAAFIYRHLLAPDSTEGTSSPRYVNAFGAIDPRLQGDDLWQALSGIPATAWQATG